VVCIATSTTTWNVVAARFSGTSWTGFINLGGSSTSDRYSCTAPGGSFGVLTCQARGNNEAAFINNFKGGSWITANWSGWLSIGGSVNPGSSCAQSASGKLGCAAVASDAGLWVSSFNGTSWSGWASLGGKNVGNPRCTGLSNGKVLCAVVGLNGKAVSTVGP
jgi:hypothetical protein